MKSDRGGKVSWDARLIATVRALVRGREWGMSGKRKAVGPVRKELQGFRVLHQSLEVERCNSLLSDDPTVPSGYSLVCRLAPVVSKSSSRSICIRRSRRLSLWSHPPESEDLSQPGRLSPRAPLAALVRIRGPSSSTPRGPEGTSCLHRALFVY